MRRKDEEEGRKERREGGREDVLMHMLDNFKNNKDVCFMNHQKDI